MGFRFRKSFKAGPVRFTMSKSGISSSVGVKGFRVTRTAKGKTRTTASIPGTGISYVSESGGRKRRTSAPSGGDKRRTTAPSGGSTASSGSGGGKAPFYRRWWFIALVILLLLSSCTGGSKKKSEPSPTSTIVTSAPTDAPTPSETPSPAVASPARTASPAAAALLPLTPAAESAPDVDRALPEAANEEGKAEDEVSPEPTPEPPPEPTPEPTAAPTHTYILNASTGKFHRPGCRAVKKMKDSNKVELEETYQYMLDHGYDPCDICNPY